MDNNVKGWKDFLLRLVNFVLTLVMEHCPGKGFLSPGLAALLHSPPKPEGFGMPWHRGDLSAGVACPPLLIKRSEPRKVHVQLDDVGHLFPLELFQRTVTFLQKKEPISSVRVSKVSWEGQMTIGLKFLMPSMYAILVSTAAGVNWRQPQPSFQKSPNYRFFLKSHIKIHRENQSAMLSYHQEQKNFKELSRSSPSQLLSC